MKLKKDFNALVIVGGWNKHIFTPIWINRYLFPNEELKIEYPIEKLTIKTPDTNISSPIAISLDSSPRISSKNIRIRLDGTKLGFMPVRTKDEDFEKIQEIGLELANYLPHTPVSAYGINFVFSESMSERLRSLIEPNDVDKITDFGGIRNRTKYTHNLDLEGKRLNFSVENDNSEINFDFNFHFVISDLADFKGQLTETPMLQLKKVATDFMTAIYDLELEEEE